MANTHLLRGWASNFAVDYLQFCGKLTLIVCGCPNWEGINHSCTKTMLAVLLTFWPDTDLNQTLVYLGIFKSIHRCRLFLTCTWRGGHTLSFVVVSLFPSCFMTTWNEALTPSRTSSPVPFDSPEFKHFQQINMRHWNTYIQIFKFVPCFIPSICPPRAIFPSFLNLCTLPNTYIPYSGYFSNQI